MLKHIASKFKTMLESYITLNLIKSLHICIKILFQNFFFFFFFFAKPRMQYLSWFSNGLVSSGIISVLSFKYFYFLFFYFFILFLFFFEFCIPIGPMCHGHVLENLNASKRIKILYLSFCVQFYTPSIIICHFFLVK